MKRLLIILLLAVPAMAMAQLTPHDQRWGCKTETDNDKTIGRVFLQDGSIINGRIVKAAGKVSITTFDGNLFVYNEDEVLRVEYGKAYQPKSGALAVVLSLIIPGWGNFYVGDNVKGAVFLAVGVTGAVALLRGKALKKREKRIQANVYASQEGFGADAWMVGGTVALLASTVISAATAYKGSRPPEISNAKVSLLSFQF